MRGMIFVLFLTLIGCSWSKPEVVYETVEVVKPVFHPQRPDPVIQYTPTWKVLTQETFDELPDEAVYIGFEYNSSLKYREWLESISFFIEQQNIIICHYREELEEPVCSKVDYEHQE